MIERTEENLKQYIGQYILRENKDYKWIFKIVDVIDKHKLYITQALDIYPSPRAYKGMNNFLKVAVEDIDQYKCTDDMRLPTKEEMNIYKQYWRKIIFLKHF